MRVGELQQDTVSYRTRSRRGDEEIVTHDPRLASIYDTGHPFSTEKWTTRWGVFGNRGFRHYDAPSGLYLSNPYMGVYYGSPAGGRWSHERPVHTDFIKSNDIASGKAAIAACAPTRPQASFSTTLAEVIREGIPSMLGLSLYKEKVSSARALGSEYLNVQFGWLPLVADLTKICKALQNASKIIEQFEKDSGKNVRRAFYLPTLEYNRQFTGSDLYYDTDLSFKGTNADNVSISGSVGGFSPRPSTRSVTVTATQQRWFKGKFTYYVPSGEDLVSKIRHYESLANQLLGTRLTPAVLWELAPWSWLIDWFYDIQSHIETASLFNNDDLVLRYGYLMVKDRTAVLTNVDVEHRPNLGGALEYSTLYFQSVLETKRRVQSTPFGFGLNAGSDFSDRQWAILSALALTKAPRTLR